MRRPKGLLLFLWFPLCLNCLGAWALPNVTVEKINGFEVHLVDIGAGNSVGISFLVPYGTLHDHGRFLGRAHLLEHLMHVGTLKHPGYHSFEELLMPAGINSNASTSYNRTFYFASGKDDKTELIIKVFLSMLGGLELNPAAIENERQVVINEIVEEGIPEQSDAFMQMPFTHLLPPNHPWAMSLLGNRPSLQALSKEDLQDLYDQVYRPGIVRIAIHGNFSKPGFLERVRSLLRENVKASPLQNLKALPTPVEGGKPKAEYALATRQAPSLFSASAMAPESQKQLHIHTPDFNMGMILLEADGSRFPVNSRAMNFLTNLLGTELPGSLIHKLKTELGLITEGNIFEVKVRDRQLMYFTYVMSAAGRGHATEINELFFQALKSAQDHDVSEEFLARTKNMILHQTEAAARSAPGFMQLYELFLNFPQSFTQQIEDLKEVQARDLRQVARLFRPDQALYQTTGPAKDGMEFDATYNRHFKIEDNRAALERYMKVMSNAEVTRFDPVARPVDLGAKAEASLPMFTQSRLDGDSRERFAIDLRRGFPDTAVSMDFHLSPESPTELIAIDLVMEAFNERYLAELTDLVVRYQVSTGSGRGADQFTLTASGEDTNSVPALAWKLRKLAAFMPSADELDRARERYIQARDSDYASAFSAQIAVTRAKSLIDPLEIGGMAARKLAETLTWEKMRTSWLKVRLRANRTLTAVGALNLDALADLRAAGYEFSNENLSATDVVRRGTRYTWNDREQVEIEQAFPKSKGEEAYAVARFYKGPAVRDHKEAAAFQALATLMSNHIYIYNRGEQKLGYIHNASFNAMTADHFFMLLYGGTVGAENAVKTTDGWLHILEQIRSGEINDEEIVGALSSLTSRLDRIVTSARELAAQYSGRLNMFGDARANRDLLAAAKALTPADVRESARKYLLDAGTAYIQLTLHGCEKDLQP